MRIKKFIQAIFKGTNYIIFFSLFFSSLVMFYIGSPIIGGIILFMLSFYMIFNRLENHERRLKEIENKTNN